MVGTIWAIILYQPLKNQTGIQMVGTIGPVIELL
jgi:hypothetical protein